MTQALRAFEIQQQQAAAYGQRWTPEHAAAMQALQVAYVETGLGLSVGRTAWPLAVGTGKSQSIIALMKAQSESAERGEPALSVLVCVERLEQMAELYDEAIKAGVPADMMGCYSAESPLEDADRRRFLFATHARMLKGAQSIAIVNTFDGAERSLVIWDESVLHSKPLTVSLSQVVIASFALAEFATGDTAREAATWLNSEVKRARASAAKSAAELFSMSLSPELELSYKAAIQNTRGITEEQQRTLLGFLDVAGRPGRAVAYEDRGRQVGLIHFETLIPNELRRLVILDASHTIRLLCNELDNTVETTKTNCAIKRFDKVTIKHMQQGAGRTKLSTELAKHYKAKDTASGSPLVRDLLAEIDSYQSSEPVLIVTFLETVKVKNKLFSHEELLKHALKRAGMNPDDRSRFSFTTWGRHVAVNHFKHCRHVVLVGVLRRAKLDLEAAIAAQQQDVLSPKVCDKDTLKQVELSEMLHNILQAAGRGCCRETKDGQAEAMTVALICHEQFPAKDWQDAMPGAVVTEWKPKHATRKSAKSEAVKALRAALEVLEGQRVELVAASKLRSAAGLDAIGDDTFKAALQQLKGNLEGWRYEGRSFVRVGPFSVAA